MHGQTSTSVGGLSSNSLHATALHSRLSTPSASDLVLHPSPYLLQSSSLHSSHLTPNVLTPSDTLNSFTVELPARDEFELPDHSQNSSPLGSPQWPISSSDDDDGSRNIFDTSGFLEGSPCFASSTLGLECTGALVNWAAGSVWDTYPYHQHAI